jgi:hypothetical protein
MRNHFMELDWDGAGYHGFPGVSGPDGYVSDEEAAAWSGFEQVLGAAKRGDFSSVAQLLEVYDEAGWTLGAACAELMGDIGSRQFFDTLRPAVTGILDPTYSVDLGRSLTVWGHLSAIPTILETLGKIPDFEDAPALVQMLSVMLEPEPGVLGDIDGLQDVQAYSHEVTQQADLLAARLGTRDVVVMFGDIFSVETLLGVMRQRLTKGGRFNPYWRHKFEATTGVDCSSFYEDGILRPLQALAVLEDFEDLGGARRYKPGQRYFFGHPVPE